MPEHRIEKGKGGLVGYGSKKQCEAHKNEGQGKGRNLHISSQTNHHRGR